MSICLLILKIIERHKAEFALNVNLAELLAKFVDPFQFPHKIPRFTVFVVHFNKPSYSNQK